MRALRRLRRLRHAIALQLRAPVSIEGYAPALERAAARTKHRRLALGRRDARYNAAPAALIDLLEEVARARRRPFAVTPVSPATSSWNSDADVRAAVLDRADA